MSQKGFHTKKMVVGKGMTTSRPGPPEVWVKKYYEVEIECPENYEEELLQSTRIRAEEMLDSWLKEDEKAEIPNLDLAEIDNLPWRTFEKGSAPGSAKPDKPGWIFRNSDTPPTGDLVRALERFPLGLELGEWTIKFGGKDNTLIQRSKKKAK